MSVDYTDAAEAYLSKQNAAQVERIRKAVNKLPAGDVKKLRGLKNIYRLRVGGVRALFEKDGDAIHVFKIDNRGDVYK